MNKKRQIKNWSKFQHYQTGERAKSPEWIKVYRNLLDDIEWHELDGESAKMLVNLWMLAAENGGSLPPIKVIAFRLRVSEKQVNSILSRLPHWIEVEDSEPLAECYQGATLEEEENKKENKKENKNENVREAHDRFWSLYPHKVGKAPALKALSFALQKTSIEEICAGVERYIATKPPDRQWCNPATWLNQERWLDQPASVAQGPPPTVHFGILDEMIAEGEQNGASFIEDRSGNVVNLSEIRRGGEIVCSAPCNTEPSSESG